MSMHLVGPYMTTTKYNRKQKKPNAKVAKAQAEHEKWLRKQGVHPEQLEKRKAEREPNVGALEIPNYASDRTNLPPTSDRIDGHAPVKQQNTYSGERRLLGIATMHKSNMVPVFADKKEDAKDIANMRRG